MPSPPRLAYLTSLYPAASHTFILREVAALRSLGFEVRTCSMRRPAASHLIGPEEEEAASSTFYIIETGKSVGRSLGALARALTRPGRFLGALGLAVRTAPPGPRGWLKQAAYLAEAIVIARFLDEERLDHIHAHFADAPANVAMLASVLSGRPYSYTLHGPAEIYAPEAWQFGEKTARAAFVACISHFARSQAMYFSDPVHWARTHIIHCGVDPERYDRPAPDPDTPGLKLLFVGRLTAIKGLRVLIEALAKARKTNPEITLTLVGDGDDRGHLETLAKPLGEAVIFAGYQSQEGVAEQLAMADTFVLPSFAEGLPVVLMEAMAAGKPVICTQVGGVSELVDEGRSGFVVPPGDAETLAARILTLAGDASMRAEMGAAGRETVREEFDIRREAARLATLFEGKAEGKIRPDPKTRP